LSLESLGDHSVSFIAWSWGLPYDLPVRGEDDNATDSSALFFKDCRHWKSHVMDELCLRIHIWTPNCDS
jgi:hypothetical protein